MLNETDARAERVFLHYVDGDISARARFAQIALQLGHHCELYDNLSELAAHPPRIGFVVLRDDPMGGSTIVDTMRQLEAIGVWLSVIVVGDGSEPAKIVEAIKAGALDYITFPVQIGRLERSLARTSKEHQHISSLRRRRIEARDLVNRLTLREIEVLGLLAAGQSNKGIARQLSISPRTVEIHRANMMSKLGASHAAGAVRIALDAGQVREAV